jgi:HK97 gp10 family phage protein
MSIEVNIDLNGAEQFAQAINQFDAEMQNQVHTKLAEWAETVKTEATRQAPVRTGYLRSTIYARTIQWQTEVGADAAYAASVEFGTSCKQAKPFIQPALQQHLPNLERVLLEALDSAKTEAEL